MDGKSVQRSHCHLGWFHLHLALDDNDTDICVRAGRAKFPL